MSLRIENLPVDLEWTAKIALDGKLDAKTSGEFEKKLRTMLPGLDFLILDLAKLSYVSSAGIRVLLFAQKELSERHGKVYLLNLQPHISKVLEVVSQLPSLQVLGTEEEMDKYLGEIQKEVLKKKRH